MSLKGCRRWTHQPLYEDQFDDPYRVAYRVAQRVCGNRAEAEDIAQEAMGRLHLRWRKVPAYSPQWTARVAGNLAIDQCRSSARRERREVGAAAPTRTSTNLYADDNGQPPPGTTPSKPDTNDTANGPAIPRRKVVHRHTRANHRPRRGQGAGRTARAGIRWRGVPGDHLVRPTGIDLTHRQRAA